MKACRSDKCLSFWAQPKNLRLSYRNARRFHPRPFGVAQGDMGSATHPKLCNFFPVGVDLLNRNMMMQARQMQARLAEIQQELAEARTEASAGGGVVRAVVIGGNRVESIKISPDAVDPEDVELLEDLVTAAVNEALEAAHADAASRMGAITGGLNIPGLT